MTTTTITLADFLLARIAEDESYARNEAILRDGDPYYDDEAGDYERRFVPARVLAECDAKRRIVEWAKENDHGFERPRPVGDVVLELLALPYADHSDYQQEWKP